MNVKRKVLVSLILLLALCDSAFGMPNTQAQAAPMPRPLEVSTLTCGINWWSIPTATHHILQGSGNYGDVGVDIGIVSQFGGVASSFILKYRGVNINILEGRSAAGAGWQYRYSQSFDTNNNSHINGTDWAPVYSDRFDPDANDPIPGIGTSPCDPYHPTNNPVQIFDDGQLHIGSAVWTTPHGGAIALTHRYDLKSRVNQYWESYFPVQALYLNRTVSRANNLRIYLIGNGWVEGLIYPYESFIGRLSCLR